ncbi:hypothetical protein [Acetivibrio cellulolyticus]|uniref:hypothetical protein n=1 Tax=Acetivibrio cellulolyticus TaxID=35830 RepID=UPI0001E2C7C9|nr:hypothetical protein [Acetivibrio cellulolyticus]
MANKKKIVLFIVEGINDKTCLALCMDQLLDNNTVRFEITDGDITTQYGNSSSNIVAKVGDIVRAFSGKVFKPSDFLEVVHLVDMDGAYIPDENIVESTNEKNIYSDEQIFTSKVQSTINRNHQKQEILYKMIGLNKVWGSIPYSVYYFSCNMDHVLHNKANLNRADKDKLAIEFESEFFGKPEKFIEFFNKAEFAVKGTYGETWEFIKAGTNSLKRYSNFSVYLNEID